MRRQKLSREYKLEAVKQVRERGVQRPGGPGFGHWVERGQPLDA